MSRSDFRTVHGRLDQLDSALTIGRFDGPDEYVLGQIEDVGIDAQGNFVIADGRRRDVRVYNPKGEFLQTVGAAGEGPGEFRYPDIIAFDNEGLLYVSDRSLRLQRFRRTEAGYEYVDQVRLEMGINDLCIMRDTIYISGRRLGLPGRGLTDSILHKVSLAGDHVASFGLVYSDRSGAMVENYSRGTS